MTETRTRQGDAYSAALRYMLEHVVDTGAERRAGDDVGRPAW